MGRQKQPPKVTKMVKDLLPITDIFNEKELGMYNNLVDVYLADFDKDDLTSSDMDDILDLAKNRVLEFRLLETSKDDAERQLDISAAMEKIHKQNKVWKENLSTRRKDRINPNEFKGFSIVDLATAFDLDRKRTLQNKVEKLKDREQEMIKKRKDYTGNRYDSDVNKREEWEEDLE